MRQYQHLPKHLRHYKYAEMIPRLGDAAVKLADLKAILGDIYGDTYRGPYVRVTHKEAYEKREAKRATKALADQESSIDTIESLETE